VQSIVLLLKIHRVIYELLDYSSMEKYIKTKRDSIMHLLIYQLVFSSMSLLVLKALFIGSDFSFVNWYKYGKKYTDWYFNREEFKP
jgi:hypothetical protein